MKHYIYKTTNLINGKIYIGYHYSEDIENDPYLGSGEVLLRAIRYHGKNNFKREILFEFDNQDDAYKKERELVTEDFVKDRDTYNMALGGRGWAIGNEPHNKDKITIFSPVTNKNYYVNETELQKFLDDGYILGSKTKNHRVPIRKGDIIKYVDPKEYPDFEAKGWVKSNTTHNKICMTHLTTNKLKYVNKDDIDLYIQNGYIIGNLKSGVNKGTIYVSKDGVNKRIDKSESEQYLLDGWELKRHQKPLNIRRMYNLTDNKVKNIPLKLVDEYLKNGWILGHNYSSNKNKPPINK